MLPSAIALAIVVTCGPRVSALNPSLDINQYAHTASIFREGFSAGRVTAIAQTPDGYLWLGTELGLLRFDGVRTVPWVPPGTEHLPSAWIRSLHADRDGTLWIGTLEGLAAWRHGRLTLYPELAGHSVQTLLTDRQGTLWAGGYAGTAGALCAITADGVACERDSFGQWVGSLYEDRGGALWATAQTGLWRWRPGAPERFAMASAPVTSSQSLSETDAGTLLIAVEGGIAQFVEGEGVVGYPQAHMLTGVQPDRLLRDRDGALWIGTTERGLLRLHRGRFDSYAQANGLSGNFVARLFEDREGNVWVATKNGLDRFRGLAVETLSTYQGLPSAPPWSVLAARDGSVWFGSVDGVSRWQDGEVTVFRSRRAGRPAAERADSATARGREIFDSGLPDDGVGTLFEDVDGRLWVSTLRGIAYFERGRFVSVPAVPEGRTPAMAGDAAGNIWIINEPRGLLRLRRGVVAEQIPWSRLQRETAPTTLVVDPVRGGVWLGFRGNVVHVKDGRILASFTTADGLSDGRVHNLRIGAGGALWIATEKGLSHIRSGRVVTLNGRNGLPCDAVHWSMRDDADAVWLYTACGLLRVPSGELEAAVGDPGRVVPVTMFDGSDGVGYRATPPLYRPQVARTSDGRLWFLPGDGASVIDPHHLPRNVLPPPVRVEQVTADGQRYAVAAPLRLPPRLRELEVDYTALSLVAPEKNRFRIKLEGRDRDWQDVGSRRQAFYADLAPGSYRFRVRAANNSGVWSDADAFADFTIAPAYFQTTWFRGAVVVSVLTLLTAGYWFRLRQVARDFNLRLDERVHERTRIARELHDTLLQSFQGLMLRFQSARDMLPASPARAIDALDGALERADQALTEGRDAIQNLRSSANVSNELAQAIAAMAADVTGSQELGSAAAAFRLSVEGSPRALHPLVSDDIHRIAQEALRNAFCHARAGRIEAEITYAKRELRVRIRDDGTGIDPQQLQSGRARHWGLTTMRERAEQIGSELSLWSELGAGTEVELRVPGTVAYLSFHRRGLASRLSGAFVSRVEH